MKRALLFNTLAVLLCCGLLSAQAKPAGPAKSNSGDPQLTRVLDQMDKASVGFKTAQADFVWDQYTKVVNDHDKQKGTIYFRRESKGVQMAADINDPAKKYVLYTDNSVQVYQPGMDQATKYSVGKNKSEVESFMVLGFGGSGHDLLKSFDVTYDGNEKVGGVDAQKLVLVPKAQALRNNFNKIVLWIDPSNGLSVQQQLFSPNGDYRLAQYSNIKKNEKIADTVFKLKTTPNTKWTSAS
jgi:outer membrane lipoprotein-sorting protein